jgi:hypothetical protein
MPERNARDDRRRAKAVVLLAATIIVVGGAFLFIPFLQFTKRRAVGWVVDTQTPNTLIRVTQFRLGPRQQACLRSVTITPNSRYARFQPHPLPEAQHGGPAVDVVLTASGYQSVSQLEGGYDAGVTSSSVSTARAGEKAESTERTEAKELTERAKKGQPREGGEEGAYGEKVAPFTPRQHVAITPPATSRIGTACFVDAGRTPVLLDGTSEPRFLARSTMTIDGKPVAGTIGLTFFAERPTSRLEQLGEIFDHASNLTDHLIPVWLIWIIVIVALIGIPVAVVRALYRSLREDTQAAAPP